MILRIIIAVFLLTSCVDPISFTVKQEKPNFLIVSGFISNEEGKHLVALSRSADFKGVFEGGFNKPETKAIVKIIDDEGNEEVLNEETQIIKIWEYDIDGDFVDAFKTITKKGVYVTESNFKAKIGRTYHLYIKTLSGEEYQSQAEVLRPSNATIDSVYYIHETHQQLNTHNNYEEQTGFQYYIDITLNQKDSYYKYEWDATYILETPLAHPPSVPTECYISEKGDLNFNILSGSDFSKQKIEAHPLNFMQLNYRYNIKYSYNLKQYAISKEAHEFFRLIKDQLTSTGSIFDPIPSKILGNLYNINDSNEIVLGYFGAFGVSSKRIFISRNEMPKNFLQDSIRNCFYPPPLELPPDYCFDCTLLPGSSQVKPDFWE